MLNMNFAERVVIDTGQVDWEASPSGGVERKFLAREAPESGHATSIVRYRPGSAFPRHAHPGGEEIFVLDGVFSDEHGDYPAGTYIRNPHNSSHSPSSEQGCTLFVKLAQFDPADTARVVIDTRNTPWLPGQGGLEVMPLHDFGGEHTALVRWPEGERFVAHRHFGGEEILVLSGELLDEHGRYPQGSWQRNPHMSQHQPYVEEKTVILVKVGHLPIEA